MLLWMHFTAYCSLTLHSASDPQSFCYQIWHTLTLSHACAHTDTHARTHAVIGCVLIPKSCIFPPLRCIFASYCGLFPKAIMRNLFVWFILLLFFFFFFTHRKYFSINYNFKVTKWWNVNLVKKQGYCSLVLQMLFHQVWFLICVL